MFLNLFFNCKIFQYDLLYVPGTWLNHADQYRWISVCTRIVFRCIFLFVTHLIFFAGYKRVRFTFWTYGIINRLDWRYLGIELTDRYLLGVFLIRIHLPNNPQHLGYIYFRICRGVHKRLYYFQRLFPAIQWNPSKLSSVCCVLHFIWSNNWCDVFWILGNTDTCCDMQFTTSFVN